MSDTQEYKCLQRVRVDGKPQEIGTVVSLDTATANSLPDDAIEIYENPAKASVPVADSKGSTDDAKAAGAANKPDNMVDIKEAAAPELVETKASDEALEHASLINLVTVAIHSLDRETEGHYTESGKPQVDAINATLGEWDDDAAIIGAAIRDEAYAAIQAKEAKDAEDK